VKKKEPIIIKHSLFPIQDYEEEEDNNWQVSYLDIITIVLGFLIILLSLSQITKSEFSSLSSIFGKLADQTEYFTTPIGNIQEELVILLKSEIEAGSLEIIRDLNDLRIRFKSDDLYSSGEAKLQAGSEDLLDRVLISMQQLQYNDFNIDIEGHTDNTPIQSSIYPSNWELSTARAANIVKYFNDMGIPARRLKASGYADSRPVIDYDSLGYPFAASKETNRRVVLGLYYSSENLVNQENLEESEDSKIIVFDTLENDISIEPSLKNPDDGNLIVLADQPAIVTLVDQNKIEEVKKETETSNNNVQQDQLNLDVPLEEVENQSINKLEVESKPLKESKPNIEPVLETPTKTEEIPSTIPSLLKVDARCQFSLQLGEFALLQSAFKEASEIENKISDPVILTYNGNNYSIRTTAVQSFSTVLNRHKVISNTLKDSDVYVLHQCYNNTINRPKPVKYLIQFGAFQNRSNGSEFMMELFDKHNIQAFMNRISDTYNILTGPYNTRNEVLEKLSEYRNLDFKVNLFIRHQPETVFNYNYAYQIQVNVFSNNSAANNLALEIETATGINTRVENLNGAYSVMTSQTSSLSDTQARLNQIKALSFNTNPVIFTLEYRP
jgi:chemotaxis protein MotB